MLIASLNAKMVDGVAVVVKGSAITLYDIKQEMKSSKLDEKNAVNLLIRKKLEKQEIKERKISVSSGEVYDDIKKTAKRNNLSVGEFYEAVRSSSGLTSAELKVKIKEKLLAKKLYSAISYTAMQEPGEDEIKAYYKAHKNTYTHPSGFKVTIYQSKTKEALEQKISNPMLYTPDIATNDQTLPYDRITPELATLLKRTPLNSFSAVVPDGKGNFMSFYLKEVQSAEETGLDSVKNQIVNSLMSEQREQVLGDFFARLRQNADIKMIRNVE